MFNEQQIQTNVNKQKTIERKALQALENAMMKNKRNFLKSDEAIPLIPLKTQRS